MKTKSILAILLVATVAVATERVRFAPASASSIKITGTSTLHEWTMQGTTINGAIDIAPEVAADPLQPEAWKSERAALVTVKIPVAAIKSEHDRMNRIMLEAMKAAANPEIRYELTEAVAEKSGGEEFVVKTKGKVTIAGVTRDLEMNVTAKRDGAKRYLLTGEAPIKMTDFGITPPVTMLGTLKTGNDVRVTFRWAIDRIQ
jgi:polyisoprenoid-binding protein YceI